MRVTVAICTYNRAKLLDSTLGNLRNLSVPAEIDWELVVVNNRSTDDTADVLRRHREHLPLRPLFEQQQGVSHARNLAVAESRGDWIFWTDDDVLVSPDWMQLYLSAIAEHPEAVLLGGDVVPLFGSAPPAWINKCWELVECAYAVRNCQGLHQMHAEYPPYGANMAIRTDVQRQFSFRTDLGRRARQMIGGEEVDVVSRVLEAGHLGLWVPESRVQHYLPDERLNLRYVRRFFSGIGHTDVLLDNDTIPSTIKLARRVLTYNLAYGALRLTSSRMWMPKLIRASLNWGMLRGRWAA